MGQGLLAAIPAGISSQAKLTVTAKATSLRMTSEQLQPQLSLRSIAKAPAAMRPRRPRQFTADGLATVVLRRQSGSVFGARLNKDVDSTCLVPLLSSQDVASPVVNCNGVCSHRHSGARNSSTPLLLRRIRSEKTVLRQNDFQARPKRHSHTDDHDSALTQAFQHCLRKLAASGRSSITKMVRSLPISSTAAVPCAGPRALAPCFPRPESTAAQWCPRRLPSRYARCPRTAWRSRTPWRGPA